ncbi:MAG: helix-turn-helix domain-containing protein [Parcubacteria group bacterium]|nr:helix-turn-helix domain-containing protein [Parcubacteria group bacterium]
MKPREKNTRKRAIRLRKRGLSYKEIGARTGLAKSTLSYWLKTISLSQKHRKRLYTKQIAILSRGSKSIKERRKVVVDEIIKHARNEIRVPLSPDSFHLFGVALYWAEGSKGKLVEFTNSDPHLILFMVKWVERTFGVSPQFLKATLNIYSQQNEKDLKKFWSELIGIPCQNFGKSFVKPANKGFKKNTLYYGTIRIYVPKSVDNRHRIYGWVQAAMSELDKKITKTQKQWRHLEKIQRPVNLG